MNVFQLHGIPQQSSENKSALKKVIISGLMLCYKGVKYTHNYYKIICIWGRHILPFFLINFFIPSSKREYLEEN